MLSMVVHRGISVNLPKAMSAAVDKRDYVSLTITEAGDVYLDDHKTSLKEMEALLIEREKDNPNLRVYIRGDKKAFYERVVDVLDLVRKAGLNKVSLETEFKESRQLPEINSQ